MQNLKLKLYMLLMVMAVGLHAGCFGGGSSDDDDGTPPDNSQQIAAAKTQVADTRDVFSSFESLEDPAEAFGDVLGGAIDASGPAGSDKFEVLSELISLALEEGNGTHETFGCKEGNAASVANYTTNTAGGVSTTEIDGEVCFGDELSGFKAQAVDITLVHPEDADTSEAATLAYSINAVIECDILKLTLNGQMTITRRGDAQAGTPTLEAIGGFAFNNTEISLMQLPNGVTVTGLLSGSIGGCTEVEGEEVGETETECDSADLTLTGEASDGTSSTALTLTLNIGDGEDSVGLSFTAEINGEMRDIDLNFFGEVDTEILSMVTLAVTAGTEEVVFTFTGLGQDDLFQITVVNSQGTLIIREVDGPDNVIANVFSGDNVLIGTLEETDSGVIIRYTDGSFESLF